MSFDPLDAMKVVMAEREAHARALIVDSLPRGTKWLVDHPQALRALRRARLWSPPTLRERVDGTRIV